MKASPNQRFALNLSWGSGSYSSTVKDLLSEIIKLNVPVFAAAGNSGKSLDLKGFYPASLPLKGLIPVGSFGPTALRSSFSNFGTVVKTWAPGEDILSTIPGPEYERKNGTSMATPFATGVAVLMLTKFPTMSAEFVQQRMQQFEFLNAMELIGGERKCKIKKCNNCREKCKELKNFYKRRRCKLTCSWKNECTNRCKKVKSYKDNPRLLKS